MPRQTPLQLSFLEKPRLTHGGATCRGRRKTRRPFDPKRALHITMRSGRARGSWSLLHPRNRGHVLCSVHLLADRFGVRIYRFSNVGNHLHFLLKAPTRAAFKSYLRALAGTIALKVSGAGRGRPLGGRFWDHLAFSRVVGWGRDFKFVQSYLLKNLFESVSVPAILKARLPEFSAGKEPSAQLPGHAARSKVSSQRSSPSRTRP